MVSNWTQKCRCCRWADCSARGSWPRRRRQRSLERLFPLQNPDRRRIDESELKLRTTATTTTEGEPRGYAWRRKCVMKKKNVKINQSIIIIKDDVSYGRVRDSVVLYIMLILDSMNFKMIIPKKIGFILITLHFVPSFCFYRCFITSTPGCS